MRYVARTLLVYFENYFLATAPVKFLFTKGCIDTKLLDFEVNLFIIFCIYRSCIWCLDWTRAENDPSCLSAALAALSGVHAYKRR